jgi:hypothetical protein
LVSDDNDTPYEILGVPPDPTVAETQLAISGSEAPLAALMNEAELELRFPFKLTEPMRPSRDWTAILVLEVFLVAGLLALGLWIAGSNSPTTPAAHVAGTVSARPRSPSPSAQPRRPTGDGFVAVSADPCGSAPHRLRLTGPAASSWKQHAQPLWHSRPVSSSAAVLAYDAKTDTVRSQGGSSVQLVGLVATGTDGRVHYYRATKMLPVVAPLEVKDGASHRLSLKQVEMCATA